MMITQTGKFQKFEFQTLAGISSNTGRSKSNQILSYWCCTVRARLSTVAMLLDDATVEPSFPSPDPSREKRREEEKRTQGPLPASSFPARCRPPWRRQSRHTALRGRASTLPARERGRRDRGKLQTQPGPPQRRASGRAYPRRSGL
jgi:hypothetical protein